MEIQAGSEIEKEGKCGSNKKRGEMGRELFSIVLFKRFPFAVNEKIPSHVIAVSLQWRKSKYKFDDQCFWDVWISNHLESYSYDKWQVYLMKQTISVLMWNSDLGSLGRFEIFQYRTSNATYSC